MTESVFGFPEVPGSRNLVFEALVPQGSVPEAVPSESSPLEALCAEAVPISKSEVRVLQRIDNAGSLPACFRSWIRDGSSTPSQGRSSMTCSQGVFKYRGLGSILVPEESFSNPASIRT